MRVIRFSCLATLPISPSEIAEQILDMSNWEKFTGYGPLPGIRTAEFERQTEGIVGSRIAVANTDGSRHVEEIVEWLPGSRIALRMQNFSAPLSVLVTQIDEFWEFKPAEELTSISRSFQLHCRSRVTAPIVWLISRLLKRAIDRHLRQMNGSQQIRTVG